MKKNKLTQLIHEYALRVASITSDADTKFLIATDNRVFLKSPDSPVKFKKDDLLNRWNFAANIFRLIEDFPQEWSQRIGIFGTWGEGKTTILKFIEQMANEKKYIITWFNPWEASNRSDLWSTFAFSVYESIENSGIQLPSMLKHKIRKFVKRISPVTDSMKILEVFSDKVEYIRGALNSPLKFWLSVDQGEMINIPNLIKNKKIIVLIDDLDRANPKIVPHLLLSLREVIDLPFFIFVLAFDPNVVNKAIKEYHSGWDKAPQFIDKIIDFQYWLPDVPEINRWILAECQIKEFCGFLNLESFKRVFDLVPSNPRRLKQFIRHLRYLKPEVLRHYEYELSWVILLLFQLLKFEFPYLYSKIIDCKEVFDYIMALSIINIESEKTIERINKNKENLFLKLNEVFKPNELNESEKDRIIEILTSIGTHSFFQPKENLYYHGRLVDRSHAITWKEFDSFFHEWVLKPSHETCEKWMNRHSKLRDENKNRLLLEVFETAINFRLRLLEEAADTNYAENMRMKVKEAERVLRLIEQLCFGFDNGDDNFNLLGIDQFIKLVGMIEKWIHFRNDIAYIETRKFEMIFMIVYVENAHKIANKILEFLTPWDVSIFSATNNDLIRVFRCELATIAQEYIADEIIQRFAQQDGIHDLWGHNKMLAEKFVLFRGDSPIWEGNRLKIFFDIANEARAKPLVQENFIEFIRMLSHYSQEGFDIFHPEVVAKLAGNIKIVKAAWDAALSRPLQPRAIGSFKKHRDNLAHIASTDEHLIWHKQNL